MSGSLRFSTFSTLVTILLLLWSRSTDAQHPGMNLPALVFDSLVVYSGDAAFSSTSDGVRYARRDHLGFSYTSNEQIIRGDAFKNPQFQGALRLLPSSDFDILDSLDLIGNSFYKFRVRFKNLSETEFTALEFEVTKIDGAKEKIEIPLFHYTETTANFYPGSDDLYLGEARKFELVTNNIDNLILDGEWKNAGTFDYRLVRSENSAAIYIEPKSAGEHPFKVSIPTKRPFLNTKGEPTYQLPELTKEFAVKNSRHIFLRMDIREITRDPKNPKSTEIQLDNNRQLQIGKTYRVEASEEVGSPLVAEIFTIRRLTNDKVICDFRPYSDHRLQDGYLFIKDGDTPVFMTNVEISPTPSIDRVMVMRNGEEWTPTLQVKPGEVFELKIEGNSLKKARFFFEELAIISSDSVAQSDISRTYRMRVPINVSKRKLNVYDGDTPTGITLVVTEHQRPRPLDFVYINYGEGEKEVDLINQPILYSKTVKDLVITFDREKIDKGEQLYGRQHLQIRARIEDKDGNLIETRNLGNFMACPGETSPRSGFYPASGCRLDDIFLNSYLSRKTHSLNEWSRIELIIEHVAGTYGGEGYTQRVVIYNQKRIGFDVDVSIPAGLVTQKIGQGETLSPLLNGIGFAMVAQFSFYKKDEIQRLQPFKAGIGFLAQNAFNFNPEAERDLGIILITSVYPVKSTSKFSFPLFGGFGYFMQDDTFFFMIGPGIRVSF